MMTIPNALSIFRIVAAPFLLWVSYLQMPNLFFILFGLMLFSDAIDGLIARILNQTSELGARLDSYGDMVTYLATPIAVWWLWPDLITQELHYIIAAIIIYILPAFFALVKFGALASYHTWITKISALLMSIGVVILLIFHHTVLFHFSVWFLVIEAVENIAITLMITEQRSDIKSLWHI